MREAVINWLANTDLATDSLFLDFAPKIAREAGLDVSATDEEFSQVVSDNHGSLIQSNTKFEYMLIFS